MTTLFIAAFLSAVAFAAEPPSVPHTSVPAEPPTQQTEAADQGTIKMAKVMFVEPKDGATVSKTFTAKFAIEGMKIANAGTMTPGTGHHHLIVDGAPVPKGKVIPADATHLHFGKGQAETTLTLKPGRHTLTLQFADGAHQSYGEMMSQTITITVK